MHAISPFQDPFFFSGYPQPGLAPSDPQQIAQIEALLKGLQGQGFVDQEDAYETMAGTTASAYPFAGSTDALPFELDPELLEAVRKMQQGLAQSENNVTAPTSTDATQQGAMSDVELLIAILQMLMSQRQNQGPQLPAQSNNAGSLSGGPRFSNAPTQSGTWNGGGGGGATAAPQGARSAEVTAAPPGTQARANVPWISQFDASRVQDAGPVACYRACRAMMQAAGYNQPAGTGNAIQVATAEDGNGRVTVDRNGLQAGRAHIDRELDAGRPVTIGVSYKDANYNRDGITDHFVVVNGRGVDDQGRTFYTFHDPGSQNGQDLKLYVDATTGNLVNLDGKNYEMSMVVPSE